MATHSIILSWKIPEMEEYGGLKSMGSQRVRHDWAFAHTHTLTHINLVLVLFYLKRVITPVQFSSLQSLSHFQLFTTPWTTAHQASLSITSSWSVPKELVMPSKHLILCCPLLLLPSIFHSIRSFQTNQLFTSGGQSIGVSASASVLPMNIQDGSRLG